MAFRVYILENPQGHFYIGHTDSLERRLSKNHSEEKSGPNTRTRMVLGKASGRSNTLTDPAYGASPFYRLHFQRVETTPIPPSSSRFS